MVLPFVNLHGYGEEAVLARQSQCKVFNLGRSSLVGLIPTMTDRFHTVIVAIVYSECFTIGCVFNRGEFAFSSISDS
jgi:hypothetical protein